MCVLEVCYFNVSYVRNNFFLVKSIVFKNMWVKKEYKRIIIFVWIMYKNLKNLVVEYLMENGVIWCNRV